MAHLCKVSKRQFSNGTVIGWLLCLLVSGLITATFHSVPGNAEESYYQASVTTASFDSFMVQRKDTDGPRVLHIDRYDDAGFRICKSRGASCEYHHVCCSYTCNYKGKCS